MRVLFAGTPQIAVPSLEVLAASHDVAAVLTAPDKVSGRGRKLAAPPVKVKALELGLPVLQPVRLGAEARAEAAAFECELLVVFAYGRIFGAKFLALFPRGGINMHPSALPLYRGPSPLAEVILRGDEQTALTVQTLSLQMDAGDILRSRPYPLTGRETTASLTADVAEAAAGELKAAVEALETGTAVLRPQDESAATYCSRIEKSDGLIDWKRPAREIERMVRAYNPWPTTRTLWNGRPLAVLEAVLVEDGPEGILGGPGDSAAWGDCAASGDSAGSPAGRRPSAALPGQVLGVDKLRGILIQTGDGILGITRLQPASRKPLDFRSFLNGFTMEEGTLLGEKNES